MCVVQDLLTGDIFSQGRWGGGAGSKATVLAAAVWCDPTKIRTHVTREHMNTWTHSYCNIPTNCKLSFNPNFIVLFDICHIVFSKCVANS